MRVSVVSTALLAVPACERLTHASDFDVLYPEAFEGLCNACPDQGLDLRRPPCPVDSSVSDRDELFVYVWRYYELGFNPEAWTGPDADSFDLGYDLDCSTRLPAGRPGQCRPRSLNGDEGVPWIPLPHGIDNAMSQRILGPLYEKAASVGQAAELDKGINDAIAKGGSTVMITVENWNGTPFDPKVTARIVSVAGISEQNGGPPRWDGNDLWDALSDGPDPESPYGAPNTTFKSDDAYVSQGTLVLDLSFLGVADLTVVNAGARLDLPVYDFAVVGDITPDELRNISVIGRWAYSDMMRSIEEVADFLSGCDPLKRAFLKNELPDLLETAPDLPLVPTGNPGLPCDAMSVGYGAEAFRAKVAGFRPVSSLPGGCPPSDD